MSCPNSKTVRSYLTPDEYDTVSGLTMATTLSVSTFMHKVCPMQEIKSFEDEVPKKAKPLWTYQL